MIITCNPQEKILNVCVDYICMSILELAALSDRQIFDLIWKNFISVKYGGEKANPLNWNQWINILYYYFCGSNLCKKITKMVTLETKIMPFNQEQQTLSELIN